MEVTVEETGTFDRTVTVRIAAEQVNNLMDQEIQRLAMSVRLPGFRPGKTPKKLLETRFRDHLHGTVIESLLRESYVNMLQEHSLRPAADPDIKPGAVERGQDFVYVATMQIVPDVQPTGYQGLALTRRIADISEADVDGALAKVREQHVQFEAVPAETVAASGDQVVMDFKGFVDDEPFEGGSSEDYTLELGSSRFIAGFEEQLIGTKAKEEKEVRVTFPEKYGADHLAGKDALFKCTIKEVRARVLPSLDDELAKLAGIQEGGLEALRAKLTEELAKEALVATEKQQQKQIHELLLAANPMELPEVLVKREQSAMVEQTKSEYQSQGLNPTMLGLTDEMMAENFKETAFKRVSLGLLLGGIARNEKLEVDEASVTARVNEMAASYGPQAQNFKKWLATEESHMDGIRASILEDKVIGWVVENSTVTEVHCSVAELLNTEEGK